MRGSGAGLGAGSGSPGRAWPGGYETRPLAAIRGSALSVTKKFVTWLWRLVVALMGVEALGKGLILFGLASP